MDARIANIASARSIIDAPAHDEPFRFGRRPTVRAPFPFTEREFARLLIMRGRVQDVTTDSDLPKAAEA